MVAIDSAAVQPSHIVTGSVPLRMPWRALTLIACLGLAYRQPLTDLLRATRYDTPLAYLGLTPFFAIALGCWQYYQAQVNERTPGGSDIAVGAALIFGAFCVGVGAPMLLHIASSTTRPTLLSLPAYAAAKRLDLLSLPLFAAGLIVLLYGKTALRWAGAALGFGLLVWPVPAEFLLKYALPRLSSVTVSIVAGISTLLPLGAIADPADGTLFTVYTPNGRQQLSIGSVCSGFNSVLAWMLVGIAVGCAVRRTGSRAYDAGTAIRLVCWLLAGALAVFASNVVRIIGLFAVARTFGIGATFESAHVSIGMILLALTVVGMFAMLPRVGLALPLPGRRAARAVATAESIQPIVRVRVSLAALTAIGFALGLLLRIGILRLLLAFGCAYFCLCLFCLAVYISGRVRPYLSSADRVFRPMLGPSAAAGAVLTIGILTALLIVAVRVKRMRAEYIPALGWRIDEGQVGALSGLWRYSMMALLCIGAAFLIRYLIDASILSARESLPSHQVATLWWAREGLIAATLVGSAVAMALTTVTVASFGPSTVASHSPLVRDFDSAPPDVPGAMRTFVQEYEWPKQSLGKHATYRRFRYDESGEQPLWVDVITTDDADALAQHNVPSCYNFHGYHNEGSRAVDIGDDTDASLINYLKPDVGETWSALYWERRVSRDGSIFFQRIVLLHNVESPPNGGVLPAYFASHDAYMQSRATRILDGLMARSEGKGSPLTGWGGED